MCLEIFTFLMWNVMTIVTHHRYLFLSLGKIYLHSTIGIYVTFGCHYLTETSIFVQTEILTNDFLFFSRTGCSFHLIFTGFIYLIHSFPKLKCILVYTRLGWQQKIILGSTLYFSLSCYIFISYIHHFTIDNFKVCFGFDHRNF